MSNSNTKRKIEPSKLHGTYPQKQEGLFMQRIPIFGGRLTAEQLRQIVEIAVKFTGDSPLHLTTRQDIEFHNIAESDTQTVLERVNGLGFSTFGAGGDSVRNITICPCCRYNEDAFDVEPVADLVGSEVAKSEMLENLGRKFKITFSGCDDPQTRPFVNDLSFIATSESTFCVVGAGSLGAKPESGIVLFDELDVNDSLPLTMAAIEMFADHGDRENRRKARFRHIRQEVGDKDFLAMLKEYFSKWKDKFGNSGLILKKGLTGWNKVATIQTIGGDIETKDALLIAELAEKESVEFRINGYHGIDIFSNEAVKLPKELEKYLDLPRIVACPGSSSCPQGVVDCPESAKLIADELKGNSAFYGKTIALSGCPNNCACSAVSDFGLVGRVKDKKPAFKITLNDGNGNTNSLGEEKGIVFQDEAGQWLSENG